MLGAGGVGLAGQDAGVAMGLTRPLPGFGARGPRAPHGRLAALGGAGAGRASAEPVGGGDREFGTPPSAALPVPHAVGQALRSLAAGSAMYLAHWFGSSTRLLSGLVHIIPLWHWSCSAAWSRLYYE